ncbi:hypothetical protein ACJMK2_000850 [Sinanodonta woodiana]|uniref:Mab-21-like HhH/H2TH-like domain-containing protein n=1 Tax=Sinanodonta woodiana TaxID=1069815 RepID=A0ABD3XSS8_SINWO
MCNIVNFSSSLTLSQSLNRVRHGDASTLFSIDISNICQIRSYGQNVNVCVTGGVADGTADMCKDDLDMMIMFNYIILTEPGGDIVPNEFQLFATIGRTGDSSGYVLLKVHPGNTHNLKALGLENSCIHVAGKGFYISSTKMIQLCMRGSEIEHRSGPAVSTYFNISEGKHIWKQMDIVYSIFCPKWPEEANTWPYRVSKCSWPPEEMVQGIVSSGCHIVPKGSKGGEFSEIEWCISFSMHEKCMIRSFSPIQYHHYILLKKIFKHKFLEQYIDVLTSYVAKTVCFWQMERNKREMWQMKCLVDMVIKSVLILRDCICSRFLPHYFIPNNNIIHGKVNIKRRDELVHDLSEFASILIDLCNRPEELRQFLIGDNEIINLSITMKFTEYYEFVTKALCHSNDSMTHNANLEQYCQFVETMHGSVISTFNILKENHLFSVVYQTLLKCISESELPDEHDQPISECILFLEHLNEYGGFSRKVRIAEIYFMLGQPDKCIDIITEALTMDTATALKGQNDIKNRASDELVGIIKRRSIMSLSQFLASYIITPIMLSEDHIRLWIHILQQDIFETLRDRPIMVDSLPYACFLLTLAFHALRRTEMAKEAVNTLICMLEEEPTKLDYKGATMCLFHYVVNLTSR